MLSETAIRLAKPAAKARKLFDGGGLYLLLTPAGGKLWRFKYRFGGREKLLALGAYPGAGLKQARAARDEARRLLAAGPIRVPSGKRPKPLGRAARPRASERSRASGSGSSPRAGRPATPPRLSGGWSAMFFPG